MLGKKTYTGRDVFGGKKSNGRNAVWLATASLFVLNSVTCAETFSK